ncbi:MAG: hypothetical protein ABEJ58_07895, partial [Halodesulfurarchaeum sp.]
MTPRNPGALVLTVVVVATVVMAATTGSYTSLAYLSDVERTNTSISTASTFSVAVLLHADHQIDLAGSSIVSTSSPDSSGPSIMAATPPDPNETESWNTLDSGTRWKLERTHQNEYSLVIESSAGGPLTFVVEKDAVIRLTGAPSLGSLAIHLKNGDPLDYTVERVRGTEWMRFTIGEFSQRTVIFAVESPVEENVTTATNGTATSPTTASNGTLVSAPGNETGESTTSPNGSSTPVTGTGNNSTAVGSTTNKTAASPPLNNGTAPATDPTPTNASGTGTGTGTSTAPNGSDPSTGDASGNTTTTGDGADATEPTDDSGNGTQSGGGSTDGSTPSEPDAGDSTSTDSVDTTTTAPT